jgi:hypothetical protein
MPAGSVLSQHPSPAVSCVTEQIAGRLSHPRRRLAPGVGPGGGAMSSIETSVGTAARSVELMARLDRQRFRVPLLAIGSTRNWAVPMMQLDCS